MNRLPSVLNDRNLSARPQFIMVYIGKSYCLITKAILIKDSNSLSCYYNNTQCVTNLKLHQVYKCDIFAYKIVQSKLLLSICTYRYYDRLIAGERDIVAEPSRGRYKRNLRSSQSPTCTVNKFIGCIGRCRGPPRSAVERRYLNIVQPKLVLLQILATALYKIERRLSPTL